MKINIHLISILIGLICLFVAVRSQTRGPTKCGVPAIQPTGINSRIVGGVPAKAHSWPWQVLVRGQQDEVDYVRCGGSILSETIIITTGHCVGFSTKNPSTYEIVAGEHDLLSTTDGPTQTRKVKAIRISEGSEKSSIAILVLAEPLVFSENVSPICLPSAPVYEEKNCFATGWGSLQSSEPTETTLHQVKLPVINWSVCKNLEFYDILEPKEFCAGYLAGGADTCNGDGGSPFACQRDNKVWYLHGITAWGMDCGAENKPGVYTSVFPYVQWIISTIASQI